MITFSEHMFVAKLKLCIFTFEPYNNLTSDYSCPHYNDGKF